MLYELTILIRPDVSMGRIQDFFQKFEDLLKEHKGRIHDSEYWGFRTLAYRIDDRGKAHYFCLAVEMESPALSEICDDLKFQKDVMRFLLVKTSRVGLPSALRQSSIHEAVSGIGPVSPVSSIEKDPEEKDQEDTGDSAYVS